MNIWRRTNSKKDKVGLWVNKYSSEFYKYARVRLNSHEDSEDVVQQTFMKAFRSIDSFKQEMNERSWLYSILLNTIRDRISNMQGRPPLLTLDGDDGIADSIIDEHSGPDELVSQKLTLDQLSGAIASLPEQFATPFVMREVSDMKYQEIADLLGIPIGTVMSRLYRARRALAEILTSQVSLHIPPSKNPPKGDQANEM
ncbi:MAG: RNA polymerase sigma factor [Candidatus Melainabacteria bacterium]|nr:RNA polymerase sigma factor [Candidatus Melainabacteria bacterium]